MNINKRIYIMILVYGENTQVVLNFRNINVGLTPFREIEKNKKKPKDLIITTDFS